MRLYTCGKISGCTYFIFLWILLLVGWREVDGRKTGKRRVYETHQLVLTQFLVMWMNTANAISGYVWRAPKPGLIKDFLWQTSWFSPFSYLDKTVILNLLTLWLHMEKAHHWLWHPSLRWQYLGLCWAVSVKVRSLNFKFSSNWGTLIQLKTYNFTLQLHLLLTNWEEQNKLTDSI